MIDKTNQKRRYNWTQLPKDAAQNTRWCALYATLNPHGVLSVSGFTHEAMGSPDSYLILYDADLNMLGLQAARLNVTKNAYRTHARGNSGGRRIHAARLIREFNIYVSETVLFPRCFIDDTGTLILNLNDTKAAAMKRGGASGKW
jgi:hypothetical protein